MRNIIHISYSSQLLRNSGEECFSLFYAEIKKTLAYKKEITVNIKYKRMISTVLICFKNYFIFKIQCIDKYMY